MYNLISNYYVLTTKSADEKIDIKCSAIVSRFVDRLTQPPKIVRIHGI